MQTKTFHDPYKTIYLPTKWSLDSESENDMSSSSYWIRSQNFYQDLNSNYFNDLLYGQNRINSKLTSPKKCVNTTTTQKSSDFNQEFSLNKKDKETACSVIRF